MSRQILYCLLFFSFLGCNSTPQSKKQELTEIESKYKGAFQSFERGLKQVTDDGEIIELPKVSYSKDSLIVKPNE